MKVFKPSGRPPARVHGPVIAQSKSGRPAKGPPAASPRYQPQQKTHIAQTKRPTDKLGAVQRQAARTQPQAPTPYRPQPVPKVLQAKKSPLAAHKTQPAPAAPRRPPNPPAAQVKRPGVAQPHAAHGSRLGPRVDPAAAGVKFPAAAQGKRGVVQALFKIPEGQSPADLLGSLLKIDNMPGVGKKLGHEKIETCLGIMSGNKINYGFIDTTDEQQVGVLYFNLLRVSQRFAGEGATYEQRLAAINATYKQRLEEIDAEYKNNILNIRKEYDIYKLAIIGAGSAAAYYVDSLGPAYDHSHTVLIGTENPWAGQRGTVAIDFINHVSPQISFPSEGTVPGSVEFRQRQEFAEAAGKILKRIDKRYLAKSVKKVAKGDDGFYRVEWTDAGETKSFRAHKVVVATGGGPHSNPLGAKRTVDTDNDEEVVDRVIDMDTFVRDVSHGGAKKTGRVVVSGTSAGIDAVEAARRYGWKVYWFGNSGDVAYLPGTKYRLGDIPLYKPADKGAKPKIVKVSEHVPLRVSFRSQKRLGYHQPRSMWHDRDVDLVDWGAPANETFDVDYFVYAQGQDINAKGQAGDFLESVIGNLTPIYDQGERYSLVRVPVKQMDGSYALVGEKQKDTFLGLSTHGPNAENGLIVIGAAAKGLAKKEYGETLNRVNRFQSADVKAYEQLGGIRSAMYGLNEANPARVGQDIDFSHADPTQLAIHIAIKYPNIKEPQATNIINEILRDRETYRREGRFPHGYYFALKDYWRDRLTRANAKKEG